MHCSTKENKTPAHKALYISSEFDSHSFTYPWPLACLFMRQAEEGMVHQGPQWYSLLLGPGEAGPSIHFVLGPMNLSAGTVGVVLGLGEVHNFK